VLLRLAGVLPSDERAVSIGVHLHRKEVLIADALPSSGPLAFQLAWMPSIRARSGKPIGALVLVGRARIR
jgi:hypothetical protein